MFKKMLLLLLPACLQGMLLYGQQQPAAFTVTDSVPAVFNGLQMGYTILSAKEKEVSDKGAFGRYSIRFYVTNTSGQAKILLYKQGFSLGGLSPEVARFDCLNATGARFTNKEVSLNLPACNVLANVEDKSPDGKLVTNRRFVQIGYWLKAGETVRTDAIVIVPLTEKPDMVVTPVFNTNQLVGDAYTAPVPGTPNTFNWNDNLAGFIRLQNFWRKTYLNTQAGPVTCANVQNDWWSAQWQLQPVTGTNFYLIKNRWKENYLSTEDPNSMYSVNPQARASLWIIEPADGNMVRFRNVANDTYLNIESGRLQSTQISPGAWSSQWIVEQQP